MQKSTFLQTIFRHSNSKNCTKETLLRRIKCYQIIKSTLRKSNDITKFNFNGGTYKMGSLIKTHFDSFVLSSKYISYLRTSIEKSNKISISSEVWMSELPDLQRQYPIVNLAIPGSHNSMSYGITQGSQISPDIPSDSFLRIVNNYFPFFVRRWAVTQTSNVKQQLSMGIRYFDLRLTTKLKNNERTFYFCHGLYAMEWAEPLNDIKIFLDKNPKEIVILDFQHFYQFNEADHRKFRENLLTLFNINRFYCQSDGPLNLCTLDLCYKKKRQLIVIYRSLNGLKLTEAFWPSNEWPTPWPNVCDTKKLRILLDFNLQNRNQNIGFVSQCILTPTEKYISLRLWSSLKSCAEKVLSKLMDWIEKQHAGTISKPSANVIIADFIHLHDSQFCKKVIEINYL